MGGEGAGVPATTHCASRPQPLRAVCHWRCNVAVLASCRSKRTKSWLPFATACGLTVWGPLS